MTSLVHTRAGKVEGRRVGAVHRFLGMRYAGATPRFERPRALEPWTEVRPAFRHGPRSPQPPSLAAEFHTIDPTIPDDEDCLTLNVWTPGLDGAKRPVMVWIHGGGYMEGSAAVDAYDGATLAHAGDLVVVSVNYRLGPFGFLHLGSIDSDFAHAGALGLHDQLAALAWVRDNAAAFGGDPGNVTIFGESAGGGSVGTLLASPAAEPLFDKAILLSGTAWLTVSQATARSTTEAILASLGARDVRQLRQMAATDLLTAAMGAMIAAPFPMVFGPVAGTGVVVNDPRAGFRPSRGLREAPVLVGYTQDEWNHMALKGLPPIDDDAVAAAFAATLRDPTDRALYDRRAASPLRALSALYTDQVFRMPAIRTAESLPNARLCILDVKTAVAGTDGRPLGALHGLFVPFVFGHAEEPLGAHFMGGAPVPPETAAAFLDAVVSFARNGVPAVAGLPEWPVYDPRRRATLVFGERVALVDDPDADTRRLWESGIRDGVDLGLLGFGR